MTCDVSPVAMFVKPLQLNIRKNLIWCRCVTQKQVWWKLTTWKRNLKRRPRYLGRFSSIICENDCLRWKFEHKGESKEARQLLQKRRRSASSSEQYLAMSNNVNDVAQDIKRYFLVLAFSTVSSISQTINFSLSSDLKRSSLTKGWWPLSSMIVKHNWSKYLKLQLIRLWPSITMELIHLWPTTTMESILEILPTVCNI